MDIQSGMILHDRYEIIRLLGEGGMGAVYLAYDQSLESEVALKVNHQATPQSSKQFLREARLLATTRHSNLPRVTDYFISDDNQFLVMDYIPGDDLSKILKSGQSISIEQILDWAKQLGSALTYLHKQKPPIIHRDIKPANIKLTPDGNVILVDFGIAKAASASQATTTGAMAYTPGFAPPEQYAGGPQRTGPYSDQYALAATLYALITKYSVS